jgi:hypothetical protein
MDDWEADARKLILDLSTLKCLSGELKMWRTFHLLDDVLNHANWELARMLEKTK